MQQRVVGRWPLLWVPGETLQDQTESLRRRLRHNSFQPCELLFLGHVPRMRTAIQLLHHLEALCPRHRNLAQYLLKFYKHVVFGSPGK